MQGIAALARYGDDAAGDPSVEDAHDRRHLKRSSHALRARRKILVSASRNVKRTSEVRE
jgi:hypothetical protein